MFPELNLKTGIGSSYAILSDNYKYKSNKGNLVKPSRKRFASWLQGVLVLRNICAHNSRIYNRTSDKEWTVFVDALDKLIQNNMGVISLTAMNLPTDWKAHLSV